MNWEGQRIYTGTFPGTVSGSIMNYTYCGEDEKGFLFAVKGLGMPQAGVELVRIPYDGSKGEVLVRIKSEK